MLKKVLKRIWDGPNIEKEYQSNVLGILKFDKDIHCWTVKKEVNDISVAFTVGGVSSPNQKLLAIIEKHFSSFLEFEEMIQEFLKTESQKQKDFADDISQLKIKEIMFSRPDKPKNGMVFFKTLPKGKSGI